MNQFQRVLAGELLRATDMTEIEKTAFDPDEAVAANGISPTSAHMGAFEYLVVYKGSTA